MIRDLRAHTKAPHENVLLWKPLRARERPREARTEGLGLREGLRRRDVAVGGVHLVAELPDCNQNQTAVSDTQQLLSDF